MSVIAGVILIVCLLALVGAVVGLVRNQAVYKFHMELIDEIYYLDMADVDRTYARRRDGDAAAEYPTSWRYDELDTIPYARMVWQPWRGLKSFYRAGFPEVPAGR